MTLLYKVPPVNSPYHLLGSCVVPNFTRYNTEVVPCFFAKVGDFSLFPPCWISSNYLWTTRIFYMYSGVTNNFYWLSIQRTLYTDKRQDDSKSSILLFVSGILQPIVMVWFIWTRLLTGISCNIFACNLQRYFAIPSWMSLLYVGNANRWYVTSCFSKKKVTHDIIDRFSQA